MTWIQAPSFIIPHLSAHVDLSTTLHFHPYEYHMTGSIFTAVENVFKSLQSHSNGRKRKHFKNWDSCYSMIHNSVLSRLGIMGRCGSLSCREIIFLSVSAHVAAVEMSSRRSVIASQRARPVHVTVILLVHLLVAPFHLQNQTMTQKRANNTFHSVNLTESQHATGCKLYLNNRSRIIISWVFIAQSHL